MSELEHMKHSLELAENILYPIISGVGIVANVFVITIITIWEKAHSNRTVANVFAVNLAIADLLFCVVLPLYMPVWLVNNGWIYGAALCKIFEVIKFVNFRASILFLTLMSIDRYLAIVYTLNSMTYRTRQNAIRTCVGIWLVSILVATPVVLYANILNSSTQYPACRLMFPGYRTDIIEDENAFYDLVDYASIASEYEYDTHNATHSPTLPDHVCIDHDHENSSGFYTWEYCSFVFFFALPLVVIVFCYCEIVKTATQRSIQRSKAGSQSRVVIMVAVLVILFVICWMPFQIWRLLQLPPGQSVRYANDCLIIESTLTMLAWSNSALNPIFYSISSKRFRSKAIMAWKYIRGQDRSVLMPMNRTTIQTRTTQVCSNRHHVTSISPCSTPKTAVKYNKDTDQVTGLPQVNPTYTCDAAETHSQV